MKGWRRCGKYEVLFFPLEYSEDTLAISAGFIKAGDFREIYKGAGSDVLGSAPGRECARSERSIET